MCKSPRIEAVRERWAGHRDSGAQMGGCMHARLARYTFSGDAEEIARRVEDGMLPILQAQPGFKAYTVVESDGEIFSFSGWDSAEQAEAANALIAGWVAEHLAGDIQLTEARFGEVRLSTTLGISAKVGATA